jgi:hypothetical protein
MSEFIQQIMLGTNGEGIRHVAMGALAMAFAVAGLFFLRFWRDTKDRLFAFFALAFFALAANRLGFAF